MSVFVCRNEDGGPQTLVSADSHIRAAELYAEGVGLPKGQTMAVRWHGVRSGESGTVFVAHGGTVFGSEDRFVFTPSCLATWVVSETVADCVPCPYIRVVHQPEC